MPVNRRTAMTGALGTAGLAATSFAAPLAKAPLFLPPPLPIIAALRLVVTDFGAVGDGRTKNTLAIQQALDRCAVLGGGTVEIPAGHFVTGTIFLRSNTRLLVAAGGELIGSGDLTDYPLTQVRWEGKWIKGHASLIHAMDVSNIAVSGPGKIVGSDKVGGMPRPDYPFRHPALIEPVNARGVLLEGFSTAYDAMWNIHPTFCDNLTIRGLTIRSSERGRDGIDIDSCRHVRIESCDIATGDDCISLKSGRGLEGAMLARPTEDVVITGCTFADSNWACIGIGSEMSGGIRHVRIEHCTFQRAKTYAIYLKGQVGRGGFVEDVEVGDSEIAGTGLGAIRINFTASGKKDENPVPGSRGIPHAADFRFRRLKLRDVPQVVEGWEIHPDKPLDGLLLEDITGSAAKGIHIAYVNRAEIRRVSLTGLKEPLVLALAVPGLKDAAPLTIATAPPELAPSAPYNLK